ncbi:helix-turn-helix domain-containing protein [Rhodobacteraceae bacterium 2CG4]|uniref:Helix-turn-helix domain-containing protein n=1 Tax=Halovulum marinum TaxID=2662447 RepID=A0A6L5Z445_9RHOB|nr:helix-turn-helix transcriptional regulator [Halovulum marinum]MSU90860.1 helix-turn-helix domain-containing protein [Halovulum marinum]
MQGSTIGKNLERIMRERGYNPSRLAREAGFGHTTVRDIIQGRVASPRFDTISKLAGILGCKVSEITGAPGAQSQDDELQALWSQLLEEERSVLIMVAKAQLEARRARWAPSGF